MNTREMRDAIDELASEAWDHREEPGYLDRVNEIRQLATAQQADDVYSMAQHTKFGQERVGTAWVGHHKKTGQNDKDSEDKIHPMYSKLTQAQLDLEAGMKPILDGLLTWEERDLIRWTYHAQLSRSQTASVMHLSKRMVQRKLDAVHEKLKAVLLKLAMPEEAADAS